MKVTIGIDPGKTGGWAAIDAAGKCIDAEAFSNYSDFTARMKLILLDYPVSVVLEQVCAMPPISTGGKKRFAGTQSSFVFGANYGGWQATLELLKLPYQLVRPQAWQKAILGTFPKGESKARALAYAQRLHPDLGLKKKDSGISDAICMAHYGRRFL